MTDASSPGRAGKIASMTAFARRTVADEGGELAWEIKSVNGKGLDIRLRCPGGFEAEEGRFRTRIAAALTRGSVQAVLSASRTSTAPTVRVNEVLLRGLVEAVGRAVPAGAAERVGPLTLDGLLAVRGVLEIGEGGEPDLRRQGAGALALLDAALDDVIAMRAGEGEALRRVLVVQIDKLDTLVEAAEAAPGRTPQAMLQRLVQAVAGLLDAVPALDPARLHQEAVLLAMRADVREELDRLRLHAGAVRSLLMDGGPVGRRLDFLAQELGREASTLCAKSADAGLTTIGLALRNQIEQFREQVQNLE